MVSRKKTMMLVQLPVHLQEDPEHFQQPMAPVSWNQDPMNELPGMIKKNRWKT